MNRELLLQHFHRISEAPDAISRLRRFILDLAVRGKLVEQDPNDEPAAELLKRIQAEKERLGVTQRRKDAKKGRNGGDACCEVAALRELPFDLPVGWEWVRLGETGHTQTGTTPSKVSGDNFGNFIPFIKPGDLYQSGVDYNNEGLSETGLKNSGRNAPAGSLLMVCIGTIGKCQLIDRDCSFNQQINSVTPYKGVCSNYLLAVCLSDYFQKSAWDASARTTISILNKGKWELLALPLPPLAEQQRIVAKVDELMTLCDQLEAERNQREAHRDKLVAASLNRISTTTAEEAKDAAHFHLNLLPRLTTTPEHIKQLRQTILNLAVRGRLVEQDPDDEPAGELLKRATAAKALLMIEKGIKREKDVEYSDSIDEAIAPEHWCWAHVADVALIQGGKRLPAGAVFSKEKTPHIYIRVTDMKDGTIRTGQPSVHNIRSSACDSKIHDQ